MFVQCWVVKWLSSVLKRNCPDGFGLQILCWHKYGCIVTKIYASVSECLISSVPKKAKIEVLFYIKIAFYFNGLWKSNRREVDGANSVYRRCLGKRVESGKIWIFLLSFVLCSVSQAFNDSRATLLLLAASLMRSCSTCQCLLVVITCNKIKILWRHLPLMIYYGYMRAC